MPRKRRSPPSIPDEVRKQYRQALVRPNGVSLADVDSVLADLARRRLPLDRILPVLFEASYRQDHELMYSLPELKRDLDRAYEIRSRAGRHLQGPDEIEHKEALNRAFHAVCEILSRYDARKDYVLTLQGEDDDVVQFPASGGGFGEMTAATICFHAVELRNDPEPFEWTFENDDGTLFKIVIGGGEVTFSGDIRAPIGHREGPKLSGYGGAIEKAREKIRRESEKRGPVERFRSVATELREEKPELRDELDAVEAKLPPPLPTVAAHRPLDAFGRLGEAARALKKHGVPRNLALKLLGLASRSHPLRPEDGQNVI